MNITIDIACRFLLHTWTVLLEEGYLLADRMEPDENIQICLKDALDPQKSKVKCLNRDYRLYKVAVSYPLYHVCHPRHMRREINELIDNYHDLYYDSDTCFRDLENIKEANIGKSIPIHGLSVYDKERLQEKIEATGGWWVCESCEKVFDKRLSFIIETIQGSGRALLL